MSGPRMSIRLPDEVYAHLEELAKERQVTPTSAAKMILWHAIEYFHAGLMVDRMNEDEFDDAVQAATTKVGEDMLLQKHELFECSCKGREHDPANPNCILFGVGVAP